MREKLKNKGAMKEEKKKKEGPKIEEVKSSLDKPDWVEKAHAPVKVASSSGTGGLSKGP